MLSPTPPDLLVDAQGRPYFLWDCELTLEEFRARLADPDPDVCAYHLGKLMRQAKPDDVFTFTSAAAIREQWAILAAGGDLDRALADAPKKDGGFSPLTLAWLLRDWRPAALARSSGATDEEAESLARFHADLLNRITNAAAPD